MYGIFMRALGPLVCWSLERNIRVAVALFGCGVCASYFKRNRKSLLTCLDVYDFFRSRTRNFTTVLIK